MAKQYREGSKHDFTVEVEDIGTFVFARRTMRDEFRIQAEYSRLTEGVPVPALHLFQTATQVATLKVLTVEAPDDWNIDAMDPLDEASYDKLDRVHAALRDKEDTFRKVPDQGREGNREETE